MVLNCTPKQFDMGLEHYFAGQTFEYAFDFLTDVERKFLLTGDTAVEQALHYNESPELAAYFISMPGPQGVQ